MFLLPNKTEWALVYCLETLCFLLQLAAHSVQTREITYGVGVRAGGGDGFVQVLASELKYFMHGSNSNVLEECQEQVSKYNIQ